MSRSFIRVLFGDYSETKYPFHRGVIDGHIKNRLKDKYSHPFVSYVMGSDNFKVLTDLGLDCVLVDEKPLLIKHALVHKIIGLEAALKDFDEVVLLDWDCAPTAPLTDNFWDVLNSKDVIQCPMYKCPRAVNTWRSRRIPPKLLSAGFFVYMRDKEIPGKLLKWINDTELINRWSDETYYSKYIDDLMGGWQDPKTLGYKYDEYLRRFEPSMCNHVKATFHNDKSDVCFYHPVKNKAIVN